MKQPFYSKNNRAGYATITGPGRTQEYDTCSCVHCNRVWAIHGTDGKENLGGWCRQCQAMICSDCAGKPCTPFEKKLELYESRRRMFRGMGLDL